MTLLLHQRITLLKSWDLSCPKCGAINSVRVAGIHEFSNSPHRWFCHCGVCGKNFNPRRKGGDDMASIMETARRTLPKDKLGPLLAAGKTNKEIGIEHGKLPHWAVSNLKKEYWPNGFSTEEYQEGGIQATQPEPGEPNLSFENCDWAIPVRSNYGPGKALVLKENGVKLTSEALKALLPGEFVGIGVQDNILVVAQVTDSKFGYRIPGRQKTSQIGGKTLVKFLMDKHGLQPGKYELEEYREGYLIAKIS